MLNSSFISFPVLTTQRLTLRQLEINDEQEIFTLRTDREINKYLDRKIATTIDDSRDFINKVIEQKFLYWAITFSDQHVLAGTICLFNFSKEDDTCEIGFELLTDFQGKGIMTEAVEKVVDYAFNTIQVEKVQAFIHRDNIPSIKLVKKCGFREINDDKGESDLIGFELIAQVN